jgi:PAS domain S-box-containing protein
MDRRQVPQMSAMAGMGSVAAPGRLRVSAATEPRNRVEASVAQHEDSSLDRALAQTGDGAFVITGDGRIVLWNRSAEKILGYAAREAIGRSCCDLFVGRDGENNRLCYKGCHVMALARMGDAIQSFDMQTRTKAGRPTWLNISILVTSNGHNGPITIHLFRDVTATKELLNLVQERLAAPAAPAETNGDLTRREIEILRLVATGADTKTAAERLHVSPATVRNHVQNILGKLGVHSRLQAVAYATTHRLL